jgi:hypothetical protein
MGKMGKLKSVLFWVFIFPAMVTILVAIGAALVLSLIGGLTAVASMNSAGANWIDLPFLIVVASSYVIFAILGSYEIYLKNKKGKFGE